MKFLSIALFAGAVLGQASVISDALDNISTQTTALNNAVSSFSGQADVESLQAAATAVINAINSGNSAVSAIEPIDAGAASGLIPNINALASQVNDAITNLDGRTDVFAPFAQIVVSTLQEILSATNTFAQTTYSKIPDSLREYAGTLVQPIIDSLNTGISTYQGVTPPAGGSSSSGTAAPTGSSSAVVSSGTPTAPVYPTGSASSTLITSAPIGTGSVVPTGSGSAVVPTITSVAPSGTAPAPYNPSNAASQLTGGFAAAVVAAAVAVAAF